MEPKVRNTYQMVATEGDQVRHLGNADFKVVIVMLANFKKKLDALVDDEDLWFYALKDENFSTSKSKMDRFRVIDPVEKAIAGNDAVRRFYQKLNKKNFEEVATYLRLIEEDAKRDEALRAEGRAEGKKEILDMFVRKSLKRERDSDVHVQEASIRDLLSPALDETEISAAISRVRPENIVEGSCGECLLMLFFGCAVYRQETERIHQPTRMSRLILINRNVPLRCALRCLMPLSSLHPFVSG